jgi:hypothetical protein
MPINDLTVSRTPDPFARRAQPGRGYPKRAGKGVSLTRACGAGPPRGSAASKLATVKLGPTGLHHRTRRPRFHPPPGASSPHAPTVGPVAAAAAECQGPRPAITPAPSPSWPPPGSCLIPSTAIQTTHVNSSKPEECPCPHPHCESNSTPARRAGSVPTGPATIREQWSSSGAYPHGKSRANVYHDPDPHRSGSACSRACRSA